MMRTLQCIWMHRSLDHLQQVPPDVAMTTCHLDNGCCCCLPTTVSWTERTDVYRIPKMAATGGRGDGEKERGKKMKREEEDEEEEKRGDERKKKEVGEELKRGKKRKREESEEVEKERGAKRKREEELEEEEEERGDERKKKEVSEELKKGKKRKREESEEVEKERGAKRKREEEHEEEEKREEERKKEDESKEGKRGKKRKRGEEIEEEEKRGKKRKREEEEKRGEERKKEKEIEEEEKKRRGEDARVLEDEDPRPGTSQAPGTSINYPKFNIKHLTVHQVLGRGSFGVVGLASVPGRNNYVAIKGITKTADNAAILQRERRILMLARDCPFLCHLYAAQQSQDHAFFITEYLSGGSLEALLTMCSSLNIEIVRFYTAEIACGLHFLHRQNVVHRDIKPDNIMLDRDGHICIIDLGLAQDGVTSSNKIQGVTGTLLYMAPEVLQRKSYHAAVDWWSLGIVVSRMSAGRSPFYFGCNREMAHDSITREKPNIPSWLPADLKHLIQQLLHKNPEKRLGVNRNIRDHPFFTTINWEELEQKRAQPPFTPFEAALKKGDLRWSEVETALHPLEGFSFIAPSWEW
ncbi:protein kinase C delta type-like isoform X3 [Hyla sarda]|uniref:protein kinase C delta type-like isoform X3 n=1 Tax=Hyla sarda TaxID=327740 RepID=UPI0024C29765|nr:protein kinase C delta type-like isoform X3 [Hyla sarda]